MPLTAVCSDCIYKISRNKNISKVNKVQEESKERNKQQHQQWQLEMQWRAVELKTEAFVSWKSNMASRWRKLNNTEDINLSVFRRFFQNFDRNQSSSAGRNKSIICLDWLPVCKKLSNDPRLTSESIKYTGGQRVLWSIKIVINSTLFDAQNAGNK